MIILSDVFQELERNVPLRIDTKGLMSLPKFLNYDVLTEAEVELHEGSVLINSQEVVNE